MRFWARRAQLPPAVTYEQMRENVAAVMGRGSYKTPRIDRRLPLLVTHVMNLPEPSPTERNGVKRLELLRDQALMLTLFCTGMRRDEVARLDRIDVEDGESDRALITGKGEKERVVFFDAKTQAALRAYLAARNDTLAPLFLRHDNRRGKTAGHGGERWRLGPQSVWATVKRYARAVGVPATTHHFRHAKASVLLTAAPACPKSRTFWATLHPTRPSAFTPTIRPSICAKRSTATAPRPTSSPPSYLISRVVEPNNGIRSNMPTVALPGEGKGNHSEMRFDKLAAELRNQTAS